MKIVALASAAAGSRLEPFEFDATDLGDDQVDIKVLSCGICHSDLSMLHNHWGMTAYPFVPGHEVVGTVMGLGKSVSHLKVGQTVGLGWFSGSCGQCRSCTAGDHNLCASAEGTIVGRYGGFASHVRAQARWVLPLPDGIDVDKAGPLFCGGITVFNPIVQCNVRPTDRVGVVGIGGLGHMAISFLAHWGCEVTAFTTSASKTAEAKSMGAHHVVNTRDADALSRLSGQFDFILVTVNVPLDWAAYIGALAPRGRLHVVGAVSEPLVIPVFPMLLGQKSVSASPLGSPATTAQMLDFCARHKIAPVTETFPMSQANEALAHLEAGRARYRVILKNDLA